MLSLRRPLPTSIALGAVLALAACGGGGDDAAGAATGGLRADGTQVVIGTDSLDFEPTMLEADAGEVSFELVCEPAVAHNLVIEETDTLVAECAAGGTETGSVDLEAGDYTYYCSLPGHRSAGMEGTLAVS